MPVLPKNKSVTLPKDAFGWVSPTGRVIVCCDQAKIHCELLKKQVPKGTSDPTSYLIGKGYIRWRLDDVYSSTLTLIIQCNQEALNRLWSFLSHITNPPSKVVIEVGEEYKVSPFFTLLDRGIKAIFSRKTPTTE
jgi:hypothetical protein